jgi:hypothetical protein
MSPLSSRQAPLGLKGLTCAAAIPRLPSKGSDVFKFSHLSVGQAAMAHSFGGLFRLP